MGDSQENCPEPGVLGFTDFDRAVVKALCAELIDIDVGEGVRQHYAVDVPGVFETPPEFSGKVPVMFMWPEDVFQPYILPSFVVRRNDIVPNFERQPPFGHQRFPVCGANKVFVDLGNGNVVQGWDEYKTRAWPTPFDIGFDILVLARIQKDGIAMLTHALKKMKPPWFSIAVVDSENCRRLYDAGPVSVSSTSELADVADRTISWVISFDVRAEVDLSNEVADVPFLGLAEVTYSVIPIPC